MLNIRKAAVCGALLLGAQALIAAPASATSQPFTGTWTSVDTDGSDQVMAIRGAGARLAVSLYDDAATVCGGAPARVSGSAVPDGDLLAMDAVVSCVPGGNPFRGQVYVEFSYDAATDTLLEPSGVVWHRSS